MKELYGSLGVVYLHSSLYLGACFSSGYHSKSDLRGSDLSDSNIKACMLSLSIRLVIAPREEGAMCMLETVEIRRFFLV